MLARSGDPFDSEDHFFEIKWDGTRALAFIEDGSYRLRNRQDNDLLAKFPEFAHLAELSGGTVLDGEIVVLGDDGRADFSLCMRRDKGRGDMRIQHLMRELPATYMVFDVLYTGGRSVMDESLILRRELLSELLEQHKAPNLVLSEGIVGDGIEFFEQARALEIEGVVAKELDGQYLAGMRTESWTKMKPVQYMHCVILGYLPDGPRDVKSLIIGTDDGEGQLVCVGRVGSGLTDVMRRRLGELLAKSVCDTPLIDCGMEGTWVEPGLFCTVSFLERTKTGSLRGPVFIDLVEAI